MSEYSDLIMVMAITLGNALLYYILISACKREGKSPFIVFKPTRILEVLRASDYLKLLILTIVVGIIFFVVHN